MYAYMNPPRRGSTEVPIATEVLHDAAQRFLRDEEGRLPRAIREVNDEGLYSLELRSLLLRSI